MGHRTEPEPSKLADVRPDGRVRRFFSRITDWLTQEYVHPLERTVTKPKPVEPFKRLD
jgi:hypothetical protein